ncbi:MAG: hypothetical protein LBI17_03480 [Rickettsiales bacterium]|jgi:hypothetical protein|nr:hypothetical protein [Rickettsiales bacterium]
MKKVLLCLVFASMVPAMSQAKAKLDGDVETVEIRGVAYDKDCMLERVVKCRIPEKGVPGKSTTKVDGKVYIDDCIVGEAFECAK